MIDNHACFCHTGLYEIAKSLDYRHTVFQIPRPFYLYIVPDFWISPWEILSKSARQSRSPATRSLYSPRQHAISLDKRSYKQKLNIPNAYTTHMLYELNTINESIH
jgi:hypothetical protein